MSTYLVRAGMFQAHYAHGETANSFLWVRGKLVDGVLEGRVINGEWNVCADSNLKTITVFHGEESDTYAEDFVDIITLENDPDEDYNDVIQANKSKFAPITMPTKGTK